MVVRTTILRPRKVAVQNYNHLPKSTMIKCQSSVWANEKTFTIEVSGNRSQKVGVRKSGASRMGIGPTWCFGYLYRSRYSASTAWSANLALSSLKLNRGAYFIDKSLAFPDGMRYRDAYFAREWIVIHACLVENNDVFMETRRSHFMGMIGAARYWQTKEKRLHRLLLPFPLFPIFLYFTRK